MPRDTILFDINETVLDLAGLRSKFEASFGDPSVVHIWFQILLQTSQVCVITGVQSNFANLAAIALESVAATRSIELSQEQKTDILGTFASLKPHDDIVPALKLLREAGYRTVAFSNSSNELVAKQITNSGLDDYMDFVISVEGSKSFKPDPKTYQFGAEKLERDMKDLRLVATHDWDTHGAMSAGMQGGYIDRSGAPYHPLFLRPKVFATNMVDVAKQIIAEDKSEA